MRHLYIGLLLSTIALAGCEERFSGKLDLKQSMSFLNLTSREAKTYAKCKAENSDSKKCKRIYKTADKNRKVIEAGLYDAKVIPGKDKINLKFLKPGSSKVMQELPVKIPKNVDLPSYKGDIDLKAAQIKRGFDIKGHIDTQESDSETFRDRESCTYVEEVRVCGYVDVNGDDGDFVLAGGRGERRRGDGFRDGRRRGDGKRKGKKYKCWTEYETYYGTQQVEYYYHYTDKTLDLDLLIKDTSDVLAVFHGTYHDKDKIYTYKGTCY